VALGATVLNRLVITGVEAALLLVGVVLLRRRPKTDTSALEPAAES
jgi:hypothetical protein